MESASPANQSPTRDGGKPAAGYPSSPRTILVAEDEHLLAQSISADLAELGYEVIGPASNGQAAIDLARSRRPDLALLDIRMPGLDGLAVAQMLHTEMSVPVIILSAFSDPAYLQAGAKLGVYGYLLKPVSTEGLRAAATVAWGRFLEHARLQDEVAELKTKLEQRKIIEKAKGILMKTMGIGEEEAMRLLQKQARDARRPMIDLAKAIIDTQGFVKKPEA